MVNTHNLSCLKANDVENQGRRAELANTGVSLEMTSGDLLLMQDSDDADASRAGMISRTSGWQG